MASIFGHGLAGFAIARGSRLKKISWRICLCSAFCSVVPDFDVIGFKWGVSYGSPLGHRGFTHSLLFAGLFAALMIRTFFPGEPQRLRLFAVLFLSTVSHGLLDAMTNGGLGVGFFIPFDNRRYFLPFRPIEVSAIRWERFLDQASHVLLNELIWIGLPCLVFWLLVGFFENRILARGKRS